LNNGLFQQYQAALGCIKNLYIWSALIAPQDSY
jgi:hypothetical protein